ncbi:MAG: serine--tRNA ligase [Micavibrio aeruginosavorus]|uniref:Serine--tRNA ligase n=1 Tax=Micavibrio aeruginosavorus TaxID=349221 RepID=A0A7T5R492_9BACT|nr:MAG: serine--tRNA ligase [Micavibrio aeruginosavorus]
MHDIAAIRKDPAAYDKNWARRGVSPQTPEILKLDAERRAVQTEMQDLQNQRNTKSKEIGVIKGKGGDAAALMNEVAAMKDRMAELEQTEAALAEKLNTILASLPNLLDADTPDGKDENDNKEVRKVGTPKRLNSQTPEHFEIGEALGMMDFETAAKMSGSRFTLMHSGLARMERALAQFMLDTHTQEHGYTEVSPPLLVRDNALYGTGQLPKFAEDLFHTTSDHWLIPTAEVSLTNIVADCIVEDDYLPRRYTAWTPCFRSEAGAAGKDTRGMIRQHQFYKVELVSVTLPEQSNDEHERMTGCAENILKKLELPFRTISLCSGDIGFGSRKTYDIEVWLPGQDRYREISSCSNCGDFQARRMKARFRRKGEKDTQFLHTLNGSGVAVGRALIAVMENYYDPDDGGVFVPAALKPYMGGIEKLIPADTATQAQKRAI